VSDDQALMAHMSEYEMLGASVSVRTVGGRGEFRLAAEAEAKL
jgi:hypothetical protein